MTILAVFLVLALLLVAVVAVIATVRALLNDGYRRVPARPDAHVTRLH